LIHLAYDGSLNGEWVSRYALRLAARRPPHRLGLVHVRDGSLADDALAARIHRIEGEAAALGVTLEPRIVAPTRGVFRALDVALPRGAEDLVVCGTRVRSRRGFLRGTVSQKLLARSGRSLVAIRVVQPGLLGDPRRFLVPLSAHRAGLAGAWPILRAFLPDAERVFLLRVLSGPGPWSRQPKAAREEAWSLLREVMGELRARLPEADFHLDGRVVVAADWAHEICVQASQQRARMVLMGASDRTLFERALSNPLERVLREAPCDVGICRGA
jgi:nucleotide-binding universal stress UspA family protein